LTFLKLRVILIRINKIQKESKNLTKIEKSANVGKKKIFKIASKKFVINGKGKINHITPNGTDSNMDIGGVIMPKRDSGRFFNSAELYCKSIALLILKVLPVSDRKNKGIE
jgi:hypothetical protein